MQKNIQFLFACIVLFTVIFVPTTLFAENVTITAIGEYVMRDNDTYTEAKKLALQVARRIMLEKINTYMESNTEVKNGIVSIAEIKQYTDVIVKVENIGDERSVLANKATVVKVNVRAILDPDALIKQVISFRNRQDIEEAAKKTSDENDKLRKEIEQLNQQSLNVVDENKYRQLNAQRREILEQIDTNEKGLTVLLRGEGLYAAAVLDRQRKEERKGKVKKFLKEIASAYKLSATTPEINDNGDGTANIKFKVKAKIEVTEYARDSWQPSTNIKKITGVNLTEFLSTGLSIRTLFLISTANKDKFDGFLLTSCDKNFLSSSSPDDKCEEIKNFMAEEEINKFALIVKLGEFEKKEDLSDRSCMIRYDFEREYSIKMTLSELKSLSQLKLKVLYDSQEYGQ